jgi:hypothetical protein
MTDGGPNRASLRIRWGERHGTVELADAQSRGALEVTTAVQAGTTPERSTPEIVARLIATAGEISFLEDGADRPAVLNAGNSLVWVGKKPPVTETLSAPPKWTEALQPAGSVRNASKVVAMMAPAAPVEVAVKEFVHHRRREVRLLGARCAAHLDQFRPLVAGVVHDDSIEPMAWDWRVGYIDALDASFRRGPEEAAMVRKALIDSEGEAAGLELYRMLWGYSPTDLQAGAAKDLVDYLGHEKIGYRALAIYNLIRITGKTGGYYPERSASSRTLAQNRWKQELTRGTIVPKDLPAPTDP